MLSFTFNQTYDSVPTKPTIIIYSIYFMKLLLILQFYYIRAYLQINLQLKSLWWLKIEEVSLVFYRPI